MADRVVRFPARAGAEPPASPALIESVLADLVQHFADNNQGDDYDRGVATAIEMIRDHQRFGSEPVPVEPIPTGLPAVLSSVDDVARVCEAAGLRAIGNDRWVDEDSGVSAAGHVGRVAVAASGWLAALDFGAPSSLLWSAIQAARGGEPG